MNLSLEGGTLIQLDPELFFITAAVEEAITTLAPVRVAMNSTIEGDEDNPGGQFS